MKDCDYKYNLLIYWPARREHAFRLKLEGLSLRQIAVRLGVTDGERVRQMILKHERELKYGGYLERDARKRNIELSNK